MQRDVKLVKIASIALTIAAISNNSLAQSVSDGESEHVGDALTLLRQAFQCPIPIKTIKPAPPNFSPDWRDGGAQYHRTNKFLGDRTRITVAEETDTLSKTYTADGDTLVDRRLDSDKYTMTWADIDEVADLSESVQFSCRDGKKCTSYSYMREKDDLTSSKRGQLPGFAGESWTIALSGTGFFVCDADTANNIRYAAEYLIKLNGGNVGEMYRVPNDVSAGVINLRAEPKPDASLIVAIPAGTPNVWINVCRNYPGSHAPWCEAKWNGHDGFVSGCCIVNAKTGKPPTERVAKE